MTINIEIQYVKRIEDENAQLKKQNETLEQDKEAIYSIWKKAMNRENNLIIDNKELKQRISKLVSENTKLQNDLFSEQLIQDETEEYINTLKQELFNLYLKHYN